MTKPDHTTQEDRDSGRPGGLPMNEADKSSSPSVGIPDAFGIECEHHYGITTHQFRDGMTVPETVYWLIRNAWHPPSGRPFDITDDNHTWEIVEHETPGWSYIRIVKNEKSPRFALNPLWVDDGAGATWFTQEFRIANHTTIAWEVAGRVAYAERLDAEAERQRDTIRGRKARAKALRYAELARREADVIRSRWPEYMGIMRTSWQSHMHEHRVPAQGIAAQVDETAQQAQPEGQEPDPKGCAKTQEHQP